MQVDLGYSARPQFIPFHMRKERWAVIVAHRRAGKTVACLLDLIDAALRFKGENGRFAYIAPYYTMASDIAWGYLSSYAGRVPGAVFNKSDLYVEFPNKARVRLYGADNPDRLRGLYLDGVVLDENADMRPSVWGEVLRPALTDRKGWAVFIGTPKGKNSFFTIWDQASLLPDWFRLELKASKTGLLDPQELEAAKSQMTEDQYAQEFECSFEAAIQGAYFGVEMRKAGEEGRITKVPYDPSSEVFTSWDLGIGDSTAIWFWQTVGREIRVIDFYEASGIGLDHYVKVLKQKDYNYGRHFLPHDAEKSELGTGKTIREVLSTMGLRGITIAPKLTIQEGIESARLLIPRCWFDEDKCKDGLEALRQYRKEFDDKLKTFKLRPLHDWSSHAADAFRYMAVSMGKASPFQKLPKIRYSTAGIV